MSNPSLDNLFLDPAWRDPDLNKTVGPREGVAASGVSPSMPRASSSMQNSDADDPFSQLSLSRGPSGETLHHKNDLQFCGESLLLCAQHFVASQNAA